LGRRIISATADWHSAKDDQWSLRVTPFYTAVRDFIDADVLGSYSLSTMGDGPLRPLLQFARLRLPDWTRR
jgi:iron complex outermembrane recepter protein